MVSMIVIVMVVVIVRAIVICDLTWNFIAGAIVSVIEIVHMIAIVIVIG